MSGDLPDSPTDDELAEEVLDFCIGCKGCVCDCPSEVDMAKLKTEVVHARRQEHGSSLRDKLFANFDALAPLGSTFVPISSLAQSIPGARMIAEGTLGIARKQALPEFQREVVRDRFESCGGAHVARSNAERKAVFFVDGCANYSHTEAGKATVRVLEITDVRVRLAERADSGRPALSKRFVEKLRDTIESNVAELAPHARDDWNVILAEPSDAVMFQPNALGLCDGPAAEPLTANAYGVCEYLNSFRLGENIDWESMTKSVAYHGHCHQKTVKKDHRTVGVLRRAGYEADPLNSGCYDMARSFGCESRHYLLSKPVGEILFERIEVGETAAVTAPGASCRMQPSDNRIKAITIENPLSGTEFNRKKPPIPAELLDYCLPN